MTGSLTFGSPWTKIAVLSFVFLNTLLFGFSDIWLLTAAFAGGVILLSKPHFWKDELPIGTIWVAMSFAWVFVIKLVSVFWALDPTKAVGNAFNHLHFLLWPLLLPIFSRSKLSPFCAERWIALSFFGLLIFYIFVFIFLPESEQNGRFGGGWGSYGTLAHVLVFYLLWLFAALTRPNDNRSQSESVMMWFAFAAGIFILISTDGRAEQIILVLGLLAISVWRVRSVFSLVFFSIGLTLLFSLITIFFLINGDRFAEVLPEINSYLQGGHARQMAINTSMGGRLEMYRIAMEAIADRPLLGWGAGLRPSHLPEYATDPFSPLHYSNFHNLYLQILLEVGVLGALISIIIFLRLMKKLVFKPLLEGNSEITLLVVLLWSVYILKSLLNAGFGYGLTNGVFIFFSAWFWVGVKNNIKNIN